MAKYTLMKTEGRAKRAQFETVHGTIQTPVFMNVGTIGAIKGAVSTQDLYDIGTQVELSNTYHLHVRPGDKVVKQLGGLHKFMNWERPILTDSGGFQVFSLAKLRKIKEEGVHFQSHIDGHKIFMGPEESMQIQSNLGSTIAMAFDECPSSVADRDYVQKSVERTTRWLARCKTEMARLNSLPDTKISVLSMQGKLRRWIWTVMQLADWQSVKHMRKCIVSLMQLYHIFHRTNRPTSWESEHRPISLRV